MCYTPLFSYLATSFNKYINMFNSGIIQIFQYISVLSRGVLHIHVYQKLCNSKDLQMHSVWYKYNESKWIFIAKRFLCLLLIYCYGIFRCGIAQVKLLIVKQVIKWKVKHNVTQLKVNVIGRNSLYKSKLLELFTKYVKRTYVHFEFVCELNSLWGLLPAFIHSTLLSWVS